MGAGGLGFDPQAGQIERCRQRFATAATILSRPCAKPRRWVLRMCLEENYSAESEYLRRQNMNSKLGDEQKKKVITSAEVLTSTQIRIKSKKKSK